MVPIEIRVRVSSSPLFLRLLLIFSLLSISSSSSISYSDHCSSFVPESPPISDSATTASAGLSSFIIKGGNYTGGDPILSSPPANSTATLSVPPSISFRPRSIRKTLDPETLALSGTLTFHGGSGIHGRFLRNIHVHPRPPRSFNRIGRANFDLSGFWSGHRGRLCLVGSGFSRSSEGMPIELSAVFKLNYPNDTSIVNSVVAGTMESLDDPSSAGYFDKIRVFVYDEMKYEYTKVEDAVRSCSVVMAPEETLGLGIDWSSGSPLMQRYQLECLGTDCGSFDRILGFPARFMSFYRIRTLMDGKVRLSIAFSMRKRFGVVRTFEPGKTLVAEGEWDREKKKLCLVACRVSDTNGSVAVSDCTIRLSLWFPSIITIEDSSTVSGKIWSGRDKNDPEYFDMVSFQNSDKRMRSLRRNRGLKYRFTKMELVNSLCLKDEAPVAGKRIYPNTVNSGDMSFSFDVKEAGGNDSWGYARLLFLDESHFTNTSLSGFPSTQSDPPTIQEVNRRLWNVSYMIRYGNYGNQNDISAEGTYDVRRGMLCMVGCRHVNSLLDCGILINIQLAPLNPKVGEYSKGKISSTRKTSDPLFFEPLEITLRGMYQSQVEESKRWMDIEILMVLLSLTFSCVFIGIQLYHIRKNPEVAPSISITMLVVLTLGYMIPLVLNFEALFFKSRRMQSSLVQGGGWLEVNEVLVRVITMVAFLLQCRLLLVTWSARLSDEGKLSMWVAERKSLLLCLPIYIIGGLIALLLHFKPVEIRRNLLSSPNYRNYRSLWEDVFPYAGLVLDAFLFPQFLLNIFSNSRDKSLAPAFYVGITVIRAFPHVYDAYRAHHYVPHLPSSYLYASRNGDFYSSAWDIIVPFVGMLFAVLIFLQQRFGGAFILTRRIKDSVGYEMVPVVSQ